MSVVAELSNPCAPQPVRNRLLGVVEGIPLEWTENSLRNDVSSGNPAIAPFDILKGFRMSHDQERGLWVPIEQLTDVHTAIQIEVLAEGGLIPQLTRPPDSKGPKSLRNSECWLSLIQAGIWPIMLFRSNDSIGTEAVPFEHDYKTNHLINTSLFPHELISRVRKVAGIELAWRRDDNQQVLLLSGETLDSKDIFTFFRDPAKKLWSNNGVALIDAVTDQTAYESLLRRLVISDDPKEAMIDIVSELQSNLYNSVLNFEDERFSQFDFDFKNDWKMASWVCWGGVILENYILRHAEGRNITPEEVLQVSDEVLAGMLRVAQKIRGDYPYATAA
jgi:hypothetical protein